MTEAPSVPAQPVRSSSLSVASRRWVYLAAGVIALLFLGLIYGWSIFAVPLGKEFGWNSSTLALTFTISMCCFCISAIPGSILTKRTSPRVTMLVSAVLLFAGFSISSLVTADSVVILYLAYGLLCGSGCGLTYNAVLGSINRWFPDKVGLSSGLLTMGFGTGSLFLGSLASFLIDSIGWRPTFVTLGIATAIVLFLASWFVKIPGPDDELPKPVAPGSSVVKAGIEDGPHYDFSLGEVLRQPSFYIFFFWATLLVAAGLAVIGFSKQCAIEVGVAVTTATLLVGLISFCNGLGRIVLGIVFDRFGYRATMAAVAIIFAVASSVILAASTVSSTPLLFLGYMLIGFGYGGIPMMSAAITSRFFGMGNYATNLSIMNISIVPASFIGPLIMGAIQTATGSYRPMFIVLIFFGVAALAVGLTLRPPKAPVNV